MRNLSILFIGLALISIEICHAQTPVLEESVWEDTIPKTVGPNYSNFWHTYIKYGLILGPAENESSNIRYGRSYDLNLGLRYKKKINSFYSLGFSFEYNQQNYSLEQDSGKLTPDSILHKTERLQFNYFNLVLYNRFNYGKRGNIIGRYVDIGVYGGLGFGIIHHTRDEFNPSFVGAEIVDITRRKLDYVNRLNYGVLARIGFNKWAIYGKYRLSDLFNDKRNLAEMPPLVVGLELGLFR
jgi:hypothetical protein